MLREDQGRSPGKAPEAWEAPQHNLGYGDASGERLYKHIMKYLRMRIHISRHEPYTEADLMLPRDTSCVFQRLRRKPKAAISRSGLRDVQCPNIHHRYDHRKNKCN